jgi:hypothetical protein
MSVIVIVLIVVTVTTAIVAIVGMSIFLRRVDSTKRDVMRDTRSRRFWRKILLRKPDLQEGESILWAKVCGWNKNGTLTKAGGLFVLDSARIVWKSTRYDFPIEQWITELSDLVSVDFVDGDAGRKAQAPFAAGLRKTCVLRLRDGDSRILFPAQIGELLLRIRDLGPKVGIAEALKS